jgi:sugar lactone lactonase YvrE
MKKIYPLFCIAAILIYFSACKIDAPVFPDSPDKPTPVDTTHTDPTIDKALLTGWWAPIKPDLNAKVYFGADNFFFQDTLTKDITPTAGFWHTAHDTIRYSQTFASPALDIFVVSKLTADSLVVKGGVVTVRYYKINQPPITSTAISTIAGTGMLADYPDGVVASATAMWGTFGISITKTGDIYFCDRGWPLIRKISAADGKVTTIAGYYGSSGGALYPPNSSAKNASLALPAFLALDNKENVYITESVGNRIGKITAGGKITCLAGCTTGIQSGFSGDGGPATAALLTDPKGIAIDSLGNVYFADAGNYRIRKISAADGKITTIAGNGNINYSGDGGQAINAGLTVIGLALDAAGNVYFTDVAANRIRKITTATGIITTIAGTGVRRSAGDDGQATSATFNVPYSIHVDATGDIYILDGNNYSYVARKIDARTGIITKVAGTGFNGFTGDGIHATGYSLKNPVSITTDAAGNIYIGEEGRIRKINE